MAIDPHIPTRGNVAAPVARRYVFVWSTQPNARRCHIVKRTDQHGEGGLIVKTHCREGFERYETSPYPHSVLPMCATCDEVRK